MAERDEMLDQIEIMDMRINTLEAEKEGKTLIGTCGDCQHIDRCFIHEVLYNHPGWKEPLRFGCSVWDAKEKPCKDEGRMKISEIRSKFYHMAGLMPVLDALEDDHKRAREAEKNLEAALSLAHSGIEKLEDENAHLRATLEIFEQKSFEHGVENAELKGKVENSE